MRGSEWLARRERRVQVLMSERAVVEQQAKVAASEGRYASAAALFDHVAVLTARIGKLRK